MRFWPSFWRGFWYVVGPAKPSQPLPAVENRYAARVGAQVAAVCIVMMLVVAVAAAVGFVA
jgi:hypothetical protein